jgi:hypothetical protein
VVKTIIISLKEKESIEEADKEAKSIKSQLLEKGFESRYLKGTNVIIMSIKGDKFAISNAVRMLKTFDVWFQILPDSDEVAEALAQGLIGGTTADYQPFKQPPSGKNLYK